MNNALLLILAVLFVPSATVQGSATYNATIDYSDGYGPHLLIIKPNLNTISAPAANEVVTAGAPYTIRWTPSSSDPVSFEICRGTLEEITCFHDRPYVGDKPNTGSYAREMYSEAPSGKNYVLVLYTGGGANTSLSPIFAISNPSLASSTQESSKTVTAESPTAAASGSASPTTPTVSSPSTSGGQINGSDLGGSNPGGLSRSDKITLGCGISIPLLTLIIAVLAWQCPKKRG